MDTLPEIRPLTSLRFIAALLVFVSHYGGLAYRRAAQPWQSIIIEGHAGVTVFFVLSGFLITLHYFPAIAERRFSAYDYFLKRVARILPLYWTMLALSLVFAPMTPFQLYAPVPLVNWTLTQAYFNDLSMSFLVAAWSLTIEASFYLLAPAMLHFCAAFGRDTRAVFLTLTAWVMGLLVSGMALVWIARASGLNQAYGFMNDYGFMLFYTIFGRGFTFCTGIFLAWLYLNQRHNLWTGTFDHVKATALFALSTAGIGVAQIGMNAAGGVIHGWPFNQAVAFFAGFLILSLTCPTGRLTQLLSKRLPVYLGRVSYALYVLQTTPMARHIYFLLLPSTGVVTLPVFYALMTGLSACFYEGVERPARRLVLWSSKRLSRALAPV